MYIDDPTVESGVLALRAAVYQQGLGTWFTGRFVVQRDGAMSTEFEYDAEPEWDAPVDPVVYAKDQDRFPRDPQYQPEWLRAQIAQGRRRLEG